LNEPEKTSAKASFSPGHVLLLAEKGIKEVWNKLI
jgi:hypothetical protein